MLELYLNGKKKISILASVIINIIVENQNRFYRKEILVMEFH